MSSVWVQLYYRGEKDPKGNRIDIELSDIPNGRISGLARRLKFDQIVRLNNKVNQRGDHVGLN